MKSGSPRLFFRNRAIYVWVFIVVITSIFNVFGSPDPIASGTRAAASGPQPGTAHRTPVSNSGPDQAEVSQPVLHRATPLDSATRAGLARNWGRLPLGFEANQGQADPRVHFLSRGRGYSLFLTGDQAVLALRKNGRKSKVKSRQSSRESKVESQRSGERRAEESVLAMRLVGADPGAAASGVDELPGKSNYFIGKDPSQWRTNVPTFARVKFSGVYPGVDLVYYGNQGGQLEYDFVIAPGADPNVIALDVAAGLSRQGKNGGLKPPLHIAADGDLVIGIDGGEVRFQKPVIYQPGPSSPSDGSSLVTRHSSLVEGHYKLIHGNRVSFDVGAYDHRRPLVIDPTLGYSTYLGGATALDFDAGNGLALDSAGDVFITGQTFSADFPITAGVVDGACNACGIGGSDAFVSKIDPLGATLLYSTYLGGSGGGDTAFGIAIDASGNAYVAGLANSADFPVVGAFQSALNGTQNAFMSELNSGGSALLYSTYLGGTGSLGDQASGIAVSAAGNAIVGGFTSSSDFPTTANAFQKTLGGTQTGFVASFNPSLSGSASLLYSTYLGGSNADSVTAVAVDSSGNAYVAGSTFSSDFPTTAGAFQTTNNAAGGGGTDAFVAKLNPAASGSASLIYATYLGGSVTGTSASANDGALGIAVDGSGHAFVTGSANSTDFPTTAGVVQPVNNAAISGGTNAFVSELAPDASSLVYSTYLGGTINDFATGIAVDSSGNAYITGSATSASFPLMDSVTPVCGSSSSNPCIIASELSSGGSTLVFSTLLGGTSAFSGQSGQAIAVDSVGNIYVAGLTDAPDFPTTPGVFQTSLAPNAQNAFVTKFFLSSGPSVSLTRTSIAFGTVALNTTSPPQSVTLTNNGASTLNITGISVTGTDSADFKQTNSCGSSVNAAANCTISVTFTPTHTTLETASVSIADDAPDSPQTISLTGTGSGSAPEVVLSPTSLTFATQVVTTTSSAQMVTLTNTGNSALSITTIATTGNFSQTNDCPSSLSAGAPCTISVTFAPLTSGPLGGSLSVTDNAGGSPQTVSLTGTGLLAPVISLSTMSLTFANQATGTTSPAQMVTVTNKGSASLTVASVTLTGANSGDFAANGTVCTGSPVGIGSECSISVTFTPTATGTRTASLTITDNNDGTSNSMQTVSLTGTGTTPAPVVTLSPTSLTFSSQLVGSASSAQTVTLSNTGSATLSLTSIAAGGDFGETNTCGSSVNAGSNCTISVTFTPTATGTRTGSVTISDNASGSPQTVTLTGTGATGAVVSLSPPSLTFSSQALGTSSAAQTVTLTNTGNAALTLTSVTTSGDFAETNTCGTSVNAGASCTISVTFKPTSATTRTGTLTVTDNASGSPQTAALTGTGITAPAVSFSPASLTFGNQETGIASAAQVVTLTNPGSATLTITIITATGDFAETNTCGTSVNTGANCTISVTFTPTATGTRTGTVTVTDNASGSPQTLSLTGTGATVPVVSLSPASVSFSDQAVGSTSTPQTVTLANTGNASLSITSVTISGDFVETSLCGTSVSAGASCPITVTFKPTATGARTGTLSVTDNASGSPQTVSLTGSGVAAAPGATLSPASLTFSSSQPIGQTSSAQTVTLTNNGNSTLTITSIVASGDFAETNTCGSSVNSNSSCTISVTFKPTAIGTRTGTVTVTDNASGSPQTVSLSGGGVGAEVSLSPSQLTFAAQLAGTTSAAQTITLTNSGNQSLSITKISATGAFAVTATGTTCATTTGIAAGSTCTMAVSFTPTAGGAQSGSLVLEDTGGTQTATLTGTGEGFSVTASGGGVATVNPGQSASYTLTLTPQGGFNQSVSLSCAFTGQQPAGTSCSVSPSSVTPTGTEATSVVVTVATTAAASASPRVRIEPPAPGWPKIPLLIVALAFLVGATLLCRRRSQAVLVALMIAAALAAACGGGGGGSVGSSPSSPTATPAGTYQLTVKATSGAGLTQNIGLTLVVQ